MEDINPDKDVKLRRKSGFFKARQSIGSPEIIENIGYDLNQIPDEEPFKRHIERINQEKEEWKNLLRKTKLDFEMIKRNGAKMLNCINDLTDADRKFLSDQPDYNAIGKKLDYVSEKVDLLTHTNCVSQTLAAVSPELISITIDDMKRKLADFYLNDSGIECFNNIDFGTDSTDLSIKDELETSDL